MSLQEEILTPTANGNGNGHTDGHGVGHAHTGDAVRVPTNFKRTTSVWAAAIALLVLAGLAVVFVRTHHHQTSSRDALEAEVRESSEAPMMVDAVRVLAAPAEMSLSLPGEARSFYDTTIFARVSGYISKWNVDIGDHVKEGQVLATIETPELDDQLTAAKAKLKSLESEVHVAEAAANFAKVSFDRWEALTPQGAVAPQARDEKKAAMESDLAKLEAAKAQVSLGEAEEQRLLTLTSFKQVRAPFDGVITHRDVEIGALVTQGSTTSTTPLYSISKADQIRVFVQVPEVDVPYMKVGMPVTATAREFAGRTFSGHLDRTDSAINPNTKMLTAEVLVPNADLTLLPGMYLHVNFESTRAQPPVRVPAGAICFRPAGLQVAVVGEGNKLDFRDVKIARDMGDYVEIEDGVKPNEEVALNVGSDLNTGDVVDAHLQVDTAPQPAHPKPAATAGPAPTPAVGAQPEADARNIDGAPPTAHIGKRTN